jgi:hypothetical protein
MIFSIFIIQKNLNLNVTFDEFSNYTHPSSPYTKISIKENVLSKQEIHTKCIMNQNTIQMSLIIFIRNFI